MSFKKVADRLLSAVVQTMIPIVSNMKIIAETFVMNTVKMFIGKIQAKSAVSPPIYARLLWIDNNPGETFDKNNPYHILQLTDMYLQINEDWTQDPLLKIQATTPAYLHWHRINAGTARDMSSKRTSEQIKEMQDQKKSDTSAKIAKAKEAAKQAALKNESAVADAKTRARTPAPTPAKTQSAPYKPNPPPAPAKTQPVPYKPNPPPAPAKTQPAPYKPNPPSSYRPHPPPPTPGYKPPTNGNQSPL